MTMLATIGVDLVGKNCVVVGASNIVGRPMAMELLNARATVTICNSKTQDLSGKLKQADVIVAAVGIPKMIQGDWIKAGVIIIDVGINRLDDGTLVGDVDFDAVQDKAAWITPVPGGVGPMTIATLLENTLTAYTAREEK
jgi:methylenetetrahydrofolate dehydrogenase (NADP+)/methenyltetrahydrofolate cyclohydrolase